MCSCTHCVFNFGKKLVVNVNIYSPPHLYTSYDENVNTIPHFWKIAFYHINQGNHK